MIEIKVNLSGWRYELRKTLNGESKMLRLASILYSIISTSLAGTGIVAVLVAGYGTLMPILAAAAAGAVLALPISWAVARQLYGESVSR